MITAFAALVTVAKQSTKERLAQHWSNMELVSCIALSCSLLHDVTRTWPIVDVFRAEIHQCLTLMTNSLLQEQR